MVYLYKRQLHYAVRCTSTIYTVYTHIFYNYDRNHSFCNLMHFLKYVPNIRLCRQVNMIGCQLSNKLTAARRLHGVIQTCQELVYLWLHKYAFGYMCKKCIYRSSQSEQERYRANINSFVCFHHFFVLFWVCAFSEFVIYIGLSARSQTAVKL